jgi:hypothetical protein
MQGLWTSRRTVAPVQQSPRSPAQQRALPESATWEQTLGTLVTARAVPDELLREPPTDAMATDPGVAIYQTMITSVRVGVVVDALRLTYRLLVLTIGDDATERLLHGYVKATGACPFPDQEICQFVAWLPGHAPAIPHLDEVAAFEIAVITAHLHRRSTTVPFASEPFAILEALGAGRLPEPGSEHGPHAITVTP